MSSINRKCHIIRGEKTLAMPRRMMFVDTETVQEQLPNGSVRQVFKLGWACYYCRSFGRHVEKTIWFEFRDSDTFWQFVFEQCRDKEKLWVIARSLTFDFTVLQGWRHLRQAGYKLKFFHDKGTTAIISVRSGKKSLIFVDSLNWFRESLAETGKRIGLPKLVIDFATCSDAELSTYCHRDVEIELENFKGFIRFLEVNNISRLCYTIGSTAMAAYLFGHYYQKIYIHNNEQAIQLERDSFRGGRVECFFLGDKRDETHFVVDVNSLYPYCMRSGAYPFKYLQIVERLSREALQDAIKTKSAVGQVLIETDEPIYAVRRKRTIFPIGRFWVTLTTPELKYAFAAGHILDVGRCVLYEQADLFSSYVKRFYALRYGCKSIGEKQQEKICKLLLNSLYGKFGQKADTWKKIGVCPDEPDRVELCFIAGGGRVRQIRYLLGEIFELIGHEESFSSFPAISAHVTAYGRLYLWRLIKQAGHENVFYCDTDSLIVNQAGFDNLSGMIDEIELGKLKVEFITQSLKIQGLKDYSIDQKSVLKGIRKNAEEIADGVYRQERWPSFRGTLCSGNADEYIVGTVTKQLRREYTKGDVMIDGRVVPFVLVESVQRPQQLW